MNYTKIWVDLKIDGFFYPDSQKIATIWFSQPLRGGYNLDVFPKNAPVEAQ